MAAKKTKIVGNNSNQGRIGKRMRWAQICIIEETEKVDGGTVG